ncbi:MAG: GNAT family N-acetyltransferase [Candidatus Dojkabacteria bacterium]|jgi:ribosomal protein S18 acetylase RimI-like enzyme|nr:GNAT family N-acetyltransferase [Candidatus Dojkabacteria bacterium]
MGIRIVKVTSRNYKDIPAMDAEKHYDCDKCMYYMMAKGKRTAKNKKEWFERMTQKYDLSGGLILYSDKKPAGYAQFAPKKEFIKLEEFSKGSTKTNAWYISCIAIKQEFRGRGLGKVLMKRVIRLLTKNGVRKVQACGRTGGDVANYSSGYWSMYEKAGFKKIGSGKGFVVGELAF